MIFFRNGIRDDKLKMVGDFFCLLPILNNEPVPVLNLSVGLGRYRVLGLGNRLTGVFRFGFFSFL
jgi:hypothetical protein